METSASGRHKVTTMHSATCRQLGYDESPNFLSADRLDNRPLLGGESPFSGFDHAYRKAREECGLQGVYLLRDESRRTETPVVFYCKAENEAEASQIHRKVWNQGVVPFVLVETPQCLRLYSGFRYDPKAPTGRQQGVLEASVAFNAIATQLESLHARAIDCGAIWDRWSSDVDPQGRVDWSLLAELEKLGKELRRRGLDRKHSHALIGKFAYLRYLRDRQILSDRKLARWKLEAADLFGQYAKLEPFWELNERLDGWLNGSVFPLDRTAIRLDHLQLVASVFMGGGASGQLAFDLGLFDFSFIPIEMLSVIYQQFLHAPGEKDTKSQGRDKGAYYTPLPLVNYVLAELEQKRPLEEGMRVLDPSCGSGAFLVQCYRMLVEKRRLQGFLEPAELASLLREHIFGVERDEDACRVAEMSLVLALLDYIAPPDLENHPEFKLPTLRDANIFQADFFDPDSVWASKRDSFRVDWLVGNPPWVEAKATKPEDRLALAWMAANSQRFPTGGNQVAEAFVWHSLPLLEEKAVAGLLLPTMTLFKMESTSFRARFFDTARTWCVANFANLAYVLFAGRSKTPTMALFYTPRPPHGPEYPEDECILTFAPFLANQPVGRPGRKRCRKDTWSVVVNGAEMREIRGSAVRAGDFLPWKEAMWGSFRDGRLLRRVAARFPSFEEYRKAQGLRLSEGFQLRDNTCGEAVEPMPELAGKRQVSFDKLRNCRRIFAFPNHALSQIPCQSAFVRKRGGLGGLEVSEPPHIIVDASRRFAIYSDEFIAVPPRKIGISGEKEAIPLLKALSVFLGSAFCTYQQYFTTPEWGVRTSLATLDALKGLPLPFAEADAKTLDEWANLLDDLVERYGSTPPPEAVLRQIDEMVYDLLGLSPVERILIEDFVRWNMQMVQGKVPAAIVAPPPDGVMLAYLTTLRDELDGFIGQDTGLRHEVCAVRGTGCAMVAIGLRRQAAPQPPAILDGTEETAAALAETRDHLVKRHSQWLYFERCLKVYREETMYVLKPLEMIHWTRRQGILDAGEIIAETLGTQNA